MFGDFARIWTNLLADLLFMTWHCGRKIKEKFALELRAADAMAVSGKRQRARLKSKLMILISSFWM